ncbi:mandelate racemase/muconate lactonizing enzyme family protein [Jiangella asiatica]|uniref:Mandelate racemase/muconate lactonizing enzyme family protein n=1 Tax=Jiangella asiatica TaxID=2530372 RepID=A0A4R5DSC9_9ACTN|nr:mandelate racemase/muconate lactonizing enzyme family protein [Jiangella asiatica]TDE14981.1 mandelate racemase/muconate lactonizing enzyme family protein [Jiangella asiatica]
MRITSISAYTVKADVRYELAGGTRHENQLPGSDYLRFAPYPQLYSQRSEAMVVRVETDEGIVGWGESQAPVGPEVAQAIVERVIGPAVLGHDPLATNVRFMDMYGTMRVRGQITGYQMDAIAGVDTALWDIRGKAAGLSVSELLGGRFRDVLPCYVTGLRGHSLDERLEEAVGWVEQGIGIKPCLGFGYDDDSREITAIRDAIGDRGPLFVDGVWKYSYPEAVRIGRVYERNGVEFFESPLLPEDVSGHARLARELDVAIAVGEPLRTRFQFQPWFQAEALDLAQPDLMRNGVSELVKIATVAESFNIDVAPHTGCLTVIGMAGTWQAAAAIPNLFVQEYQPVMLETFNRWLDEPLWVEDGRLVVPTGPGLGIDIDMDRFERDVDSVVTIREDR